MSLLSLSRRFAAETGGAVALIFGLALVPLMFSVGAAIDYTRASVVHADLQGATDAAILTIGRGTLESSQTDVTAQARKAFDAAFQRNDGTTVTSFAAVRDGSKLTINVEVSVPLAFAGIVWKGREAPKLKATAEVQLGTTDLEVALVLDNTGSMAEAGKMTELKRAAKGLIDRLQTASTSSTITSIKIAIVPFDTLVRVTASNPPPSWVRMLSTGYDEDDDHTWNGCITDRDQNYDVQGTLPSALSATLYPGLYFSCSGLQRIMPLSKDYAALRTHVDGMQPNGYTNTTIGLAWGLNVLTPGAPMSGTAEAPRPNLRKHIVFLTDGENTRNRWTTDQVQVDARTSLLCDHIKTTTSVTIHTIRLVEGNETLLKTCASDPSSLYHSISSSTNLTPIFDKIAKQILAMRLTR